MAPVNKIQNASNTLFDTANSSVSISRLMGQSVCQDQEDEKDNLFFTFNLLSHCDIRRLAAIRAREKRFETLLKTNVNMAKGNFPGGSQRVGLVPPNGLLGVLSARDLDLIEKSWNTIVKRMDRHGARLILHCLTKSKRNEDVLNTLMAKANVQTDYDLSRSRLVGYYGRRFISAVTLIIANARNDEALLAYVTSGFKMLGSLGLHQESVEDLGLQISQYLERELDSIWSRQLSDAWENLISEIMQLGLPVIACRRSEANHLDKTR